MAPHTAVAAGFTAGGAEGARRRVALQFEAAAERHRRDDAKRKAKRVKPPLAVLILRDLSTLRLHRYGLFYPDDDAGRDDLRVYLEWQLVRLRTAVPRPCNRRGFSAGAPDFVLDEELGNLAAFVAPDITADVRNDIVDAAFGEPVKSYCPDRLARRLGLTMAERTRLGITTIGAIDCNKRQRKAVRKEKSRARSKRWRIARGATSRGPREESAAVLKPWETFGISRSKYYADKASRTLRTQQLSGNGAFEESNLKNKKGRHPDKAAIPPTAPRSSRMSPPLAEARP